MGEGQLAVLLERYGTACEDMLGEDTESWRQPLHNLPGYSVGEIRYIARHECICHLSDIVRRRSIITILGNAGGAALREIGDIAGEILGWSPETRQAEIEMAENEAAGKTLTS